MVNFTLWLTILVTLLAFSQRPDTGQGFSIALCFAEQDSPVPAAPAAAVAAADAQHPHVAVSPDSTNEGGTNNNVKHHDSKDFQSEQQSDNNRKKVERRADGIVIGVAGDGGGSTDGPIDSKSGGEVRSHDGESKVKRDDNGEGEKKSDSGEGEKKDDKGEGEKKDDNGTEEKKDPDPNEPPTLDGELPEGDPAYASVRDRWPDARLVLVNDQIRVHLAKPSFDLPPDSPKSRSPDKTTYYLAVDHDLEAGIGNVRFSLTTAIYLAYLTDRTLILPPYLYFRSCSSNFLCRDMFPQETLSDGQPRWRVPFEDLYDVEHLAKFIPVITTEAFIQSRFDARPDNSDAIQCKTATAKSEGQPIKLTAGRGPAIECLESAGFSFSPPFQKELFERLGDSSVLNLDIHKYLYEDHATVIATVDTLNATCAQQECGYYGHAETPARCLNNTQITWFSPRDYRGAALRGIREDFELVHHEIVHFTGNPNRFGHQPFLFQTLDQRNLYEDLSIRWLRYAKPIYRAADYLLAKLVQRTGGKNYLSVHYRRGKEYMGQTVPGSPHMRMELDGGDHRFQLLAIHEVLHRETSLREFQRCKVLAPDYEPTMSTLANRRDSSSRDGGSADNNSTESSGTDSSDDNSDSRLLEYPWGSDTDTRIDQIALGNNPAEVNPILSSSVATAPDNHTVEEAAREVEMMAAKAWAAVEAQGAPQICCPSCRARHFYLATDERRPDIMLTLKDHGAIVLADLFDKEFIAQYRRYVGFMDWQGYLDQLLAAQGAHFLSTPYSVFSGAIINQRLNCWGGKERARSSNRFLYRFWPCRLP
ncbi:hypothetical protein DFQ26_009861 [Actinomortierella ambigua]|nr:hypothetical protein DFQ26_009861 [Actinomortierella ambigua]